jgi:hypothetical protein
MHYICTLFQQTWVATCRFQEGTCNCGSLVLVHAHTVCIGRDLSFVVELQTKACAQQWRSSQPDNLVCVTSTMVGWIVAGHMGVHASTTSYQLFSVVRESMHVGVSCCGGIHVKWNRQLKSNRSCPLAIWFGTLYSYTLIMMCTPASVTQQLWLQWNLHISSSSWLLYGCISRDLRFKIGKQIMLYTCVCLCLSQECLV